MSEALTIDTHRQSIQPHAAGATSVNQRKPMLTLGEHAQKLCYLSYQDETLELWYDNTTCFSLTSSKYFEPEKSCSWCNVSFFAHAKGLGYSAYIIIWIIYVKACSESKLYCKLCDYRLFPVYISPNKKQQIVFFFCAGFFFVPNYEKHVSCVSVCVLWMKCCKMVFLYSPIAFSLINN